MIEAFAVLLRPLFAAWDQEFGGRVRTTAPPNPPPETPIDVPVSEPVVVNSLGEVPADEACVTCGRTLGGFNWYGECEGCATRAKPERSAPDAAEPLYVRRGTGRGARYDVAPPDSSGQRYRLLVVGKRKRFTPVEARR